MYWQKYPAAWKIQSSEHAQSIVKGQLSGHWTKWQWLCSLQRPTKDRPMRKTFLTSIAVLFLATGAAHAFSETTTRGGCSTWDCRYSFNRPLRPCQRVAAQHLLDAIRARNQGQHVRFPNMRAELACR